VRSVLPIRIIRRMARIRWRAHNPLHRQVAILRSMLAANAPESHADGQAARRQGSRAGVASLARPNTGFLAPEPPTTLRPMRSEGHSEAEASRRRGSLNPARETALPPERYHPLSILGLTLTFVGARVTKRRAQREDE
jgi:hypothetical protein